MNYYVGKCKHCHSEFAYPENDVLKDDDGKEYTICIGCNELIIHNKSRIIHDKKRTDRDCKSL